MTEAKKAIAVIVAADLLKGRAHGGVVSLATFLHQTLLSSERYVPHMISTATSFRDPTSVRLLSPSGWLAGPVLREGKWNGFPCTHAGAFLAEFEFQRYQPRKVLTRLLEQFDLIQIVAGSPAIGCVAYASHKPVCILAATTAALERRTKRTEQTFLRKLNSRAMLPIVSRMERRALARANHIFAITEYSRQAFLPYTSASRISIDAVGVDMHQFYPIPDDQRSDDYLLSVGRFDDARKNVSVLFNAYARLRQRMPDAPKLILAGQTAPTATALEEARQLGLTPHIVIRQAASMDELVALYQNAAFSVLSSDEEGLGIVLLESMACATPVLSTRCGGPDYVVSDKVGILTPVGDSEGMAEQMAWLLENPNRRRAMGQAGRMMVDRRFSNTVVGQNYLNVYDRLLNAS